MTGLAIYKGEIFYHPSRIGNKALLFTRNRDKGIRHGFNEIFYDRYEKLVDNNEITRTESTLPNEDLFRVKYKKDFFLVIRETKNRVLLRAPDEYTGIKYNFKEDNRDEPYIKWVNRKDITPIELIKDNYALYKIWSRRILDYKKVYYMIIFSIIDENDNEYLLSYEVEAGKNNSGPWGLIYDTEIEQPREYGWIYNKNRYEKWVPKTAVFVYNKVKEPLRY